MRAVKSIILAAGALKRDFPNEPAEDKLVLRAISDVNLPKFIHEDALLFNGIISDLFPDTDKRKPEYEEHQRAIIETMKEFKYQRNLEFETKTIQLYETV